METHGRIDLRLFVVAVACVLLAQALLIFNPGYYSHDELQWAFFATQAKGGFFGNGLWGDFQAFQYRPLTFSLWMVLSRRLFEHPYAFHAVMVTWGAINAGMVTALLHRYGAKPLVSLLGALVFALGPYAAYTHGWVGTIADLAWLSCALAVALGVREDTKPAIILAATFLLTSMALLAKESAIVMPGLLALAWWFSGRKRHWALACLASIVPVAIYLAFRVKAILFATETTGAIYQWSFLSIPTRWLEYQLFPVLTSRFGANDFLEKAVGRRMAIAAAIAWLLLAWSLWRAGGRWLAAFLLGGVVALGPVLLLAGAANQYGYAFAAVTAGVVALAWSDMARPAQIIVGVIAMLCLWHGANITLGMHDAGVRQAHFSPALARAVASASHVVRLRPQSEDDRWTYLRLTHDVPSYRGVAIGGRARLVEAGEPADFIIDRRGELVPDAP
ncbi:hypothetical protein [Dyella sp. EPa41]|uniref:hypothetical protein n=1 Tax=Dyella sp. EPa41 TaxID=1561194 RepID=UPI001915C05C|nr:hypothetical protein [Dyella sp. EPa41]